jgi:hypothetical protein
MTTRCSLQISKRPPSRRRLRLALALTTALLGGSTIAALGVAGAELPSGAAEVSHVDAGTSWTVYHGDPLGSGIDTSGVTFSPANEAWTSPALDGQLYGEPLEATGRVFAATENDTVYALAANSGQVLWSTHVGTAVPAGDLPCGDISPTVGITGTPVVDAARGEIFAVADELVGGSVAHFLIGLNMYSGVVLLNQAVDPPGQAPAAILQRTGLNLDDGNVVFGYGGNFGDCSTYHGYVVAVPESGGSMQVYNATVGSEQGAVWLGGAAPEVDSGGNVWASSGNGSSSNPYDGSDSVFKLSSSMTQEQLFAPSDWASDNANDRDLGSTTPALLPNGTAVQVGKSQTAYLLNQSALGGIGGQTATATVCNGTNADGGDAVSGSVVYVPCDNGLEALQTSAAPPSITPLWTDASSSPGPPIVAGGLIWSIDGSTLKGIQPSNGVTVETLSLGGQANHFPTPAVGDGLLLAPSADQVHAFSGSAGIPGPPSTPPPAPPNSSYWEVASDGGIFTFGNATFYGSMGGKPLNRPIVGMAATPDENGYWLVASDGGIFNYGDAGFFGSTGGTRLVAPVVGMARTPDGGGYWLVASDGGVFSYGDAHFYGSMGGKPLNRPIVGIAATHDGLGYWLVASDGGIFAFGDASFHGSTGGKPLNKPVVGMAATPDGLGYWLVASDGGIFNYGDAGFYGSAGGTPLNRPAVDIASTPDGLGYWLVASDGGIFNYGDARFNGSMGGVVLNRPVVGLASAS